MLINKNDLPLVAEDFMNDVHFEDIDIINELHKTVVDYKNNPSDSNKKSVINTYKKWYKHTINHFKCEEVKMLELHFPPYMMHKGEHERCLEEMQYVLESFEQTNNTDALLYYLEVDLISWLINHIQTMDTVTAMFFKTGLSPCSMQH